MDEPGYLRLEQLVRTLAAGVGAPGLGDEAIQEHERLESGERVPIEGRKRLLLRLESLERHILLRHRGVHDLAIRTIQEALTRRRRGDDRPRFPDGAFLAANLPGDSEQTTLALSEMPDLSRALATTRALIGRIHEDFDGEA